MSSVERDHVSILYIITCRGGSKGSKQQQVWQDSLERGIHIMEHEKGECALKNEMVHYTCIGLILMSKSCLDGDVEAYSDCVESNIVNDKKVVVLTNENTMTALLPVNCGGLIEEVNYNFEEILDDCWGEHDPSRSVCAARQVCKVVNVHYKAESGTEQSSCCSVAVEDAEYEDEDDEIDSQRCKRTKIV